MYINLDVKFKYYIVSSLLFLFLPLVGMLLFSGFTMFLLAWFLGKPQEIDVFSFVLVGGFVGILGFLLGFVSSPFAIRKLSHRWSKELGEEKTKLTCLSFLTFLALLAITILAVSRL